MPEPSTCPRCGRPLTCEWHPVAGECENTPTDVTDAASFTCPRCGATSFHSEDVRHGYCGRCHEFTGLGDAPGYFRGGETVTRETHPGLFAALADMPVVEAPFRLTDLSERHATLPVSDDPEETP